MSILIKGMKMPKSCLDCRFMVNCDTCAGMECICTALEANIGYLKDAPHNRREDCPLAELPPHGRLIDADALAEHYNTTQKMREKDKTDYCNAFINNGELCTEWWCVEDMLDNAPTIIDAEDEK